MLELELTIAARDMEMRSRIRERELERRRIIREMVHDPRTGPITNVRRMLSMRRSHGCESPEETNA